MNPAFPVQEKPLKERVSFSYLYGPNAAYIEELYELYLTDRTKVNAAWRDYFYKLENKLSPQGTKERDSVHQPIINAFALRTKAKKSSQNTVNADHLTKQVAVQRMAGAYRSIGSRWANLDPLERFKNPSIPELELSYYGLDESDMNTVFNVSHSFFGVEEMRLHDIVGHLRNTYCRTIGTEFMHITNIEEKNWLAARLEKSPMPAPFKKEDKLAILRNLTAAEGLERYLHTQYVGQKRFSLEGGESFIVSLHDLLQTAGSLGVQEAIIGMAHRGRLNVLVNILGKNPQDLFAEFEGHIAKNLESGDVKYHQGFSSDIATPGGPLHLSLAFNPSHLEIVNPVVEGSVRARQQRRKDKEKTQVLPILVHGDAAFAGQGVVMETLNLATTRGFGNGGTLHIVINNQIGFTTSDLRDRGSTIYCTDIAKMIEAPIFHVNGDDPEAVLFVTRLAMEYRHTFKKDVVIDIVCYRKLGHNEQDAPAMTQPLMYRKIEKHDSVLTIYKNKLVADNVITEEEAKQFALDYRKTLENGSLGGDYILSNYKSKYAVNWGPYKDKTWEEPYQSALPESELKRLSRLVTTLPTDFSLHPLVKRVIQDRMLMGEGKKDIDWGMGETLAYASLLVGGHNVRLTGQDVRRGTFVHRHAVLHDQRRKQFDKGSYTPLANLSEKQGSFNVYNSILSEEAVLGFEYGYALVTPADLTIWEAQFGDFANGAQVLMDQFISSGGVKWGRLNGLVLMLPHGYEGQGPEHSSARIERYLQLCADNNMQVVQPSNAAQIFHLLRRQVLRLFRSPLIIMTPKSLLRHKNASCPLSDFTEGKFKNIIGETSPEVNPASVKRVVFCSGRLYYDLVEERAKKERFDIAIVRIEQMYPFPSQDLAEVMAPFSAVNDFVWAQDEPRNQGPWSYMRDDLLTVIGADKSLTYAGRNKSASPAVGYASTHREQLNQLLEKAIPSLT